MSVDDDQVSLRSSEPSPPPGPGAEQPPDPAGATTAQELVHRLRLLKSWSGDLSLRELQRRSGLPRSTIADALDPRRTRLPPLGRVLAIVEACGASKGAVEEWEAAWRRIQLRPPLAADLPPGDPVLPEPGSEPEDELEDGPEDEPGDGPGNEVEDGPGSGPRSGGRVRGRRRPVLFLVAAALTAAALLGWSASTDRAEAPVASTSSADGRIGYVARTADDFQILGTSGVDLAVLHPVAAGDALVVSMMLTSTSAGPVKVTDTAGNGYSLVGDVVDAYWHRTMVFAAFHAKPLNTADRISFGYPKSSKYQIAVDEFQGLTAAGPQATASSVYDHNSTGFSTSAHPLACAPDDLLLSAVGTNSGPAPIFASGWQTLPVLKLSSYRLTTAYRFVTSAEKCAATGTTTAQWEATALTFH
ncbi:hypothetical protein GCM10009760_46010 [Kitasatospora kazusensis]|uniref:Helix-turn-helix protein n=1 Tax=Kitasatospora kazusensis TaxID=407974 RepID=A0ABN3A028_9ACTN